MQPHMEELIKKHLGENKPDPKVLNLLTELEQRVSSDQGISNDLMYMLDSMPFGITLIDKNKHIVHANRDALELMGYDSLDELVGHICNDTLCPADKDKCPILDLKQSVDRSDRILISKDNRAGFDGESGTVLDINNSIQKIRFIIGERAVAINRPAENFIARDHSEGGKSLRLDKGTGRIPELHHVSIGSHFRWHRQSSAEISSRTEENIVLDSGHKIGIIFVA